MKTKPFNLAEVKPDFSNVVTEEGEKVIYLYDTKTGSVRPIVFLVEGFDGLVAADYSGRSKTGRYLRLVDELKLIDWSKLPVDTLCMTRSGAKRHLHFVEEDRVHSFYRGANSITNTTDVGHSNGFAKLIENPNFTFWQGGGCPVPRGVHLQVILRDGSEGEVKHDPRELRWLHDGVEWDIIAYRILGAAEGYSPFFNGKEF